MSARRWWAIALLLVFGVAIAWVDSRPEWDDAGVTAGAIAIAAAAGGLMRVPLLLVTVLVAGPVVLAGIGSGLGVLLAIPPALVGAFAGSCVCRRPPQREEPSAG